MNFDNNPDSSDQMSSDGSGQLLWLGLAVGLVAVALVLSSCRSSESGAYYAGEYLVTPPGEPSVVLPRRGGAPDVRAPRGGQAVSGAPVATPVPGSRQFVYSPHTKEKRKIDVSKYRAGEKVLCPYTMIPFTVPAMGLGGVAAASVPSRPVTSSAVGGESVSVGEADRSMNVPVVPESAVQASRSGAVTPAPRTVASGTGRTATTEKKPALVPAPKTAVATWVPGRPGFVTSPYAKDYQLVDVTGISPGTEVKCPYSGKVFRVPIAPANVAGEAGAPGGGDRKTVGNNGDGIVTARWADGRPGYVQSPFGKPGQLIDVTGKPSGSVVICPFTNKEFRVPSPKGGS